MKNISIMTSQNVAIEYELAATRDRIFASILDCLVFFIPYYISMLLFASSRMAQLWLSDRFGSIFFFTFFPIFLFLCYHVMCETFIGQTVGKKAIGIRCIRLDGERLSIGDHALRAAFYLIDCFLTSGFLAIVLVMSSEKAQRFGDMAANSTVVKLNASNSFRLKDILAISSLDNYQPMFPQAAKLKEEDVILIKNLLSRRSQYNYEAHQNAVVQCALRLKEILEIQTISTDYYSFLNTILKDYIVLTR